MRWMILGIASLLLAAPMPAQNKAAASPVPVTVGTFARAETDMYFSRFVKQGGFGKFLHIREVAPVDKQDVVRMNRDTVYSSAVFDLEAAPVTITLPDAGPRYMSMLIVNQDHYTPEIVYAPGRFTYTREKVGTRYFCALIRTLVNPADANDIKKVHALQDGIKVEQARTGSFTAPNWDAASMKKIRDALLVLASMQGEDPPERFGRKDRVEPISHLIGTAAGWGGNPAEGARYLPGYPKANDGKTVHKVTLKDVPVDGFWSYSIYNKAGYFEKNDLGLYSINNLTAKKNADGSVTVQFGGCQAATPNCLPTPAGWNYVLRLYRPRKAILDGTWKAPEPQPAR